MKEALVLKYGSRYTEDNGTGDGGFYRATWDKGDYFLAMTVDERSESRRAEFFYSTAGNLGKNIESKIQERKNKTENKIKNKY